MMAIETRLPAELEPCVTCGHEPDQGKRLAYLAGCLDGHGVYAVLNFNSLEYDLIHVWQDELITYAATRIAHQNMSDDLVLAWLEDVHNNKTSRHERGDWAAEVIFDPWHREGER